MILLDTHALVWWLDGSRKLPARTRRSCQQAARKRELATSAASILEVATLVRRNRLRFSMSFEEWLAEVKVLPELTIAAVTADIAAVAGSYGDSVHGDPADRLIIATAQLSDATLVTGDTAIRSMKLVRTIW
ncbi:MAG: type II toxin-antitoxin system VapC family toxin [Steroidobacteraceae bacterium]